MEGSLSEDTTRLDWMIESKMFISNQKAIRIASDQDHDIRPLPDCGGFGYPDPKPAHFMIRYNRFQENIYVIDKIDTINTSVDPND
jgi:hypothetical protein